MQVDPVVTRLSIGRGQILMVMPPAGERWSSDQAHKVEHMLAEKLASAGAPEQSTRIFVSPDPLQLKVVG